MKNSTAGTIKTHVSHFLSQHRITSHSTTSVTIAYSRVETLRGTSKFGGWNFVFKVQFITCLSILGVSENLGWNFTP